jgi:hypothetical protein
VYRLLYCHLLPVQLLQLPDLLLQQHHCPALCLFSEEVRGWGLYQLVLVVQCQMGQRAWVMI